MSYLDTLYLRHPSYGNFPLVGISQKQANEFSKWRSDRVFEYYLIIHDMLEFGSSSYSNPFTITGYFDGSFTPSYLNDDPEKVFIRDTSLLYPNYRLPNAEDRQIMINYVDSTDYLLRTAYPKKEREWMETQDIPLYLELEPCDSIRTIVFPYAAVDHGYPEMRNIKLLRNIRGNVAEWSNEENVTYGGGWPHTRSYAFKHDTISSKEPNAWTGFRNVCSWGKFEF